MSTLQHSQILDINEQNDFLNRKLRVFADFHNTDTVGRIRLNCIGTIEDLASKGIKLQSGQELTLYSEELEVNGIVEYSQLENIFVVVIDWNKIREVKELSLSQSKLVDLINKLVSNYDPLEDDKDLQKLEEFIDEIKRNIKHINDVLIGEKDINDAQSYQQFAEYFGEEEAEKIWSQRGYDAKAVFMTLFVDIMRNEPEIYEGLQQKLNQEGITLEPVINSLSTEDETGLSQVSESARSSVV